MKEFSEFNHGGMHLINKPKGAGIVLKHLRSVSKSPWYWQLRRMPVCASTEIEMISWLKKNPLINSLPRAIISGRQNFGVGQRGRYWHSPDGGVWISAAIPLIGQQSSLGLLGLAVAVAISEQLENESISVQIKWPNDLLVGNKKIAGILVKLIYRGDKIRYATIGIGLNVLNKTPKEGVALNQINQSSNIKIDLWIARTLFSIERAIQISCDRKWLLPQVKKRLWSNQYRNPNDGKIWEINDIGIDGSLILRNGNIIQSINKSY